MPKRVRALLVLLTALGTFVTAAAWQQSQRPGPESAKGLVGPLRESGPRWWKGNLHTHSFWSDGDDFPEMIADWYRRHGYHFLGLSDHNILSEGQKWLEVSPDKNKTREVALKKYLDRFGAGWVERRTVKEKLQVRLKPLSEFRSVLEEPGKFLMIPAEEITHRFAKNPVHMNAVNLRDVIKPIDGSSVAETMRVNLRLVAEQAKKAGRPILAFVNHPNWGWGVTAEDLAAVDELRSFEVFNGHPGIKNYGDETHASTERMWDIVLALRLGKQRMGPVYGMATDDSHGYHTFGIGKVNPGRGWVMVRAPYLTAETVVRAIEAGDHYCSTGVRLKDVRREGDRLTVTIDPEEKVTYKTQFIVTMKDAPLTSEPTLDKDGKPVPVTRTYSPEVGKVVAEVAGAEASYRLTGKELYVRAKVISTKLHPNPYAKGDVEVAWTQPVVP